MPRLMLTDEHWSKLRPIMLENGMYDKRGLRLTVEGILYRMRVGCQWRDLPEYFGKWNSVYKRFNEWSSKGKLLEIFQSLVQNPDFEWKFVDASYIRAHQHSAGAPSAKDEAIGPSRGGKTTKIHLLTDSCGNPIHFEVTGGNINDSTVAPLLIEQVAAGGYFIADKGYDSEKVRELVREKGMVPVVPRKKNSVIGNDGFDWGLYKYRHLVENVFARLKHFRAVATRYDKLKRNFEGMVALACAFVWLPL